MKPTNEKSKPKKGMKLHQWIAAGGDPKDFEGVNHDWNSTKENGRADKGEDTKVY